MRVNTLITLQLPIRTRRLISHHENSFTFLNFAMLNNLKHAVWVPILHYSKETSRKKSSLGQSGLIQF